MDAALHRLVRDRSGGRCEYCRLPEAESLVPFEIEHIIPRKHRGRTVAGNLAWACIYITTSPFPAAWIGYKPLKHEHSVRTLPVRSRRA